MPIMCATIYAKGNVMRNFDAYFANPANVPYQDLIVAASAPLMMLSKASSEVEPPSKFYKVLMQTEMKHEDERRTCYSLEATGTLS